MASGFNINGSDIEGQYISKSYLLDRYPEISNQFKFAALWGWGENSTGQLGDNTRTSTSSPIQTVAGGTNWKQVAAGYFFSAAIKTDGTLWTWGRNSYGQLGDNTITNRSSPVQIYTGGTNWKQVSLGNFHAVALKTDGTLWTWGRNNHGQLGQNTNTNRSIPAETAAGGTNWKQVAVIGGGRGNECAAIKTDGRLWLWGRNNYGQLGDNTRTSKSSPIQTVAGGTNWKNVAVGTEGSAAIKTDGTLWLWGNGLYGQLGDNTITNKSSPVQTVAGGTNWKNVAVGAYQFSAIKTDGTLWGWGLNSTGIIGDSTTTRKSSPVQTVAGGTNWKQVSVGAGAVTAIKTDGTLWTWGSNGDGMLGDNTTTSKSTPIQTVSAGTNWKQAAAGFNHIVSIRDDSMELNFGAGTL